MGYYSQREVSTIRINQEHENEIVEQLLKYKAGKSIKTWAYNPKTKRLNQVTFPYSERYPNSILWLPEDFGETPETTTLNHYFQHIEKMLDIKWELEEWGLEDGYYYLQPGYQAYKRNHDEDIIRFLAPFIDDEGYAEYLGEDGDRWRVVIRDGKAYSIYPEIIWYEPKASNIIGRRI